jgi:hypothetical protein
VHLFFEGEAGSPALRARSRPHVIEHHG